MSSMLRMRWFCSATCWGRTTWSVLRIKVMMWRAPTVSTVSCRRAREQTWIMSDIYQGHETFAVAFLRNLGRPRREIVAFERAGKGLWAAEKLARFSQLEPGEAGR